MQKIEWPVPVLCRFEAKSTCRKFRSHGQKKANPLQNVAIWNWNAAVQNAVSLNLKLQFKKKLKFGRAAPPLPMSRYSKNDNVEVKRRYTSLRRMCDKTSQLGKVKRSRQDGSSFTSHLPFPWRIHPESWELFSPTASTLYFSMVFWNIGWKQKTNKHRLSGAYLFALATQQATSTSSCNAPSTLSFKTACAFVSRQLNTELFENQITRQNSDLFDSYLSFMRKKSYWTTSKFLTIFQKFFISIHNKFLNFHVQCWP